SCFTLKTTMYYICNLYLHDALPISHDVTLVFEVMRRMRDEGRSVVFISHRMDEVKEIADHITIFRDGKDVGTFPMNEVQEDQMVDRKSTRLNSSHQIISYAVFCLKK